MSGLVAGAVLVLAALAWIVLGRVEDPEEELRMLGGGDRLIEAEIRRDPGLSRREAAKRVLRSLRRDSA
jgi:hypothetical protein